MTSLFESRPRFCIGCPLKLICLAVAVQNLFEVIDLTGKLASEKKKGFRGSQIPKYELVEMRPPKGSYGSHDASLDVDQLILKIGQDVRAKHRTEKKKI